MIVGDPDGQYMVADAGEAERPHEHSYTQKHDAAQHGKRAPAATKRMRRIHSFGAGDGGWQYMTAASDRHAATPTRDAGRRQPPGKPRITGRIPAAKASRS